MDCNSVIALLSEHHLQGVRGHHLSENRGGVTESSHANNPETRKQQLIESGSLQNMQKVPKRETIF